ncbi:MAG TPA: Hsp20/alpha crystallin family protein [Planctomycetota bacterium]|nr:Hsp20/alpha crystallin family protein [Planctomycetota bacterium]
MNITPRKSQAVSAPTSGLSLDRFLESFFDGGNWPSSAMEFVPALDVVEGEKDITVRAELPGMDPANIDVQVTDGMLVLTGEKQQQASESTETCYRAERRFGQFRRVVRLPAPVDADKVRADYENGVLHIHLPLSAAARPRRIEVRKSG